MQIAQIVLEPLIEKHVEQKWFKQLIHSIWEKRGEWIRIQILHEIFHDTTDRYFLIKLHDQVIGFTGYYEFDEESVGLCWHGLIPQMRGRGFSRHVFQRICDLARQMYPERKTIVELIPSDRADELVGHFENLGFVATTEDVKRLWLPDGPTWRLYRAPL